MIVDDDAFIRQSFVDHFEDRLWEVIQAESAEQALELLEEVSPDGAIVDIRLGGMDGNAFIRKAFRSKPRMGFVICTGSPEYDVPADLLSLPCVSVRVFRKPVTDMADLEEDLLQLIANMLEERL